MFVAMKDVEQYTFYDKHGDKIGHCALIQRENVHGQIYAVIEAEFPKYSEHTTWSDICEARYQFAKDVEHYKSIYQEV